MLFDLIEESKKIIGIPSVSADGTRELVEYLVPFCNRLGFHITLQPAVSGNGSANELNIIAHNLWGANSVKPQRGAEGEAPTALPMEGATRAPMIDLCPDGLLLVTHLDTVPPGDPALWTETGGDPFRATVKGDRIYGLGSADTKLDFLCKLQAIEAVGLKKIRIPLALVGTFGEERALAGVRLLRDSGVMHPKMALVSEPSQLQPVTAHKGILYLRAKLKSPSVPLFQRGKGKVITFKGRAAHGSMPHLGESAIEKAVSFLIEEKKKRFHLQLLKIHGGTVHNIVPESCVIEIAEGSSPCPKILFLEKFFQLIETAKSYLALQTNPAFDPPVTTCNVGVIRTDSRGIEMEFDFRLIPETDGNELFEIFQKFPTQCPGAEIEVIRSNAPMNTPRTSKIARHVEGALQSCSLPVNFLVKSGNTEGAIFNEMGAESIVIGPGRSVGNIHQPNEYNEISQIKKAVEFYTAFLRQFC